MRPLIKPYIKYNGGKTKLAPVLREFYWRFFPSSTLVDLFCGSGAVSLGINPERAVLVDGNPSIINLHRQARDGMIVVSEPFTHSYAEDEYELFKDWYYSFRRKFNNGYFDDTPFDQASAMFALNHYCFNGVTRGSKKTQFSTPAGKRGGKGNEKPPVIRQKVIDNLLESQKWTSEWLFIQKEFSSTTNFIPNGLPQESLIYADPPYARESTTKALQYYPEGDFCDDEQIALAKLLANEERPCILSNEDLPFVRQMLNDLGFIVFSYPRKNIISCDAKTRERVKREVFAINKALQKPEYVEFFTTKFGESV
jgi:DNA adenine methylase